MSVRIDKENVEFISTLALNNSIHHPISDTLPNFSKMLNLILKDYKRLLDNKVVAFEIDPCKEE